MMSNTRAQSSGSTPGSDWLPPARLYNPLNDEFRQNDSIQPQKDRDWFFDLTSALQVEQRDGLQCEMFTKLYLFLRDFLPNGLTGTWGHIRGNDVMNQLLCHSGESTMSRHVVSKHTDAVLTELQEWMGPHKSWQAALEQARTDSTLTFERQGSDNKRVGGRAPGLHTPTAIIAVLAIAHPDDKFRGWIGRLQIDWMIRPRENLDVKEGFWKGLNIYNLYDVFALHVQGKRRAVLALAADYNRVFGAGFSCCRRDVRRLLPAHLVEHMRKETPPNMGDGDSNHGHKLSENLDPTNVPAAPGAKQLNTSLARAPAPGPTPFMCTSHQRSVSPAQEEPIPFAGMARLKREGSPLASDRIQKVSRLGPVVTRAALSQELQDATGQLKDSMHTQLAGHQDKLRKTLPPALRHVTGPRVCQAAKEAIGAPDSSHNDTTAFCAASQRTLGLLLQNLNDELLGEIAAVRVECRDMVNNMQKQNQDALAGTKTENQELAARLQVPQAAFQGQNDAFFAMVQDLRVKPAAPGSDGFLAQCSAPAGWNYSQQHYERTLLRAAWCYVSSLESSEGDEAWDLTNAMFPGLKNEHLIKALNHVCGQLFKSRM